MLAGSVLWLSGCIDRPEVPRSAYGTVLESLPDLEEAKQPFPFPVGRDGNSLYPTCFFGKIVKMGKTKSVSGGVHFII